MKKESLILILTRLKPYWKTAEDFLLMVNEATDEDTDFINKLYELMVINMKKIKSKWQLQTIRKELGKIRQKELLNKWKDQEDLKELEALINDIK